jgi:hypothetical protein
MKKIEFAGIFIFLTLLLVPSFISAINLDVEKISSDEVYIYDLNKPVKFELKLTNNGADDSFKFYNLLGFGIKPSDRVEIKRGESKIVEVEISPSSHVPKEGFYVFNYYIKAEDGSEINKEINFKITSFEDIFTVGSANTNPEDESVDVYIKNNYNYNFENVTGKFSSPFFEFEENFNLTAYEQKFFTVNFNKEDFRKLMAGFYTLNVELYTDEKNVDLSGIIKFEEKDILTTTKKDFGVFVNRQIIEKKNEGNTISNTETVVKKNVLSRLFTSFSPEPDRVERQGFTIYYLWASELAPDEEITISITTNWFIPLIVVCFVVLIVFLVKFYSKTSIFLKKKVSFVKTKGADFGLKVSIYVQAKEYVERVHITDRIPLLVKLYEKFGLERPSSFSEKNRKIEWDFEKLEKGETRVLNYIIYSKVGVVGRFALPRAKITYEHEGQLHEAESNSAFFVAEQRTADDEKSLNLS